MFVRQCGGAAGMKTKECRESVRVVKPFMYLQGPAGAATLESVVEMEVQTT